MGDVGEHYYSPMTSYLDENAERQSRGETPDALTFSERLAKRWITGRRYDGSLESRYARSSSMTREASAAAAAAGSSSAAAATASSENARVNRAASEMRTASTFGSKAAVASTSAFSNNRSASLRQQAMH